MDGIDVYFSRPVKDARMKVTFYDEPVPGEWGPVFRRSGLPKRLSAYYLEIELPDRAQYSSLVNVLVVLNGFSKGTIVEARSGEFTELSRDLISTSRSMEFNGTVGDSRLLLMAGPPTYNDLHLIVLTETSRVNNENGRAFFKFPTMGVGRRLDFEKVTYGSRIFRAATTPYWRAQALTTQSDVSIIESHPPVRSDYYFYYAEGVDLRGNFLLLSDNEVDRRRDSRLFAAGISAGLASGLAIELLLFLVPRRRDSIGSETDDPAKT